MKIKALAITVLLFTLAFTKIHAIGIGGQFVFGYRTSPGLALLLSPHDRFHLSLGWYFGGDEKPNNISFTMDGILFKLPLVTNDTLSLNLSFGLGLFARLEFGGEEKGFAIGPRIPVGVHLLLVRDIVEIFSNIAPSVGVNVLKLSFDRFYLPMAIGVRILFR